MKKNIIKCNLGDPKGLPPQTLRDVGLDRILGRKIIRWSETLDSYGMGSSGLFGACLSKTPKFQEEWLVLMLWRATDWLVLDGALASLGVHEKVYKRQQSLRTLWDYKVRFKLYIWGYLFRSKILGWEGSEWDHFSRKIVGATIVDADISDKSTRIILKKHNKQHVLEVYAPPQWKWNDDESHLDAWAISYTTTIYS